MPISDNLVEAIIKQQAEQIIKLQEENARLLDVILKRQEKEYDKLWIEEAEKIEIPEKQKGLGKVPWYIRKAQLEARSAKVKSMNIEDREEEQNADSIA